MVLEMQIPRFAQITETGAGEAYSRLLIPNDLYFIQRVGILDWSQPSTNSKNKEPKFYDFEQIFDDQGHVRADAPL